MPAPFEHSAAPGETARALSDEQPRGGAAEGLPAPFERRLLRVIQNERLGSYRLLRVADPGPPPRAGQFAMLAAAERWGGGEDERPFLPRAFSYARWLADRESHRVPEPGDGATSGGEAHFLLEDVGPGTRRLCELRPGDDAWLLGPLGTGFTAPQDGRRALLIGGGVGIAPLAIWQDTLSACRSPSSPAPGTTPKQRNRNPGVETSGRDSESVLLGFRDAEHAAGAALLSDGQVATDDGSVGHRGFVTELLTTELDRDRHATVYACGPPPMLEAVRAICAERAVPAQLALEAGMACGFGACFGCVVPTRAGYVRLCVDGPVLDAAELERVDHPGHGLPGGHPEPTEPAWSAGEAVA